MYPLMHYLKPLSLGLLIALSSCAKKDSPVEPTPVPPSHHPAHLAFMTSVTNASGLPEAAYLLTTRDLQGGTYTNKEALPLELGNMPFYHDGLYYTFPSPMGSKTNELRIYSSDPGRYFAFAGTMPLKGGAGPVSMIYHSPTKAYLSDWANSKIWIFNPTTKTTISEIDLKSYAQAGG